MSDGVSDKVIAADHESREEDFEGERDPAELYGHDNTHNPVEGEVLEVTEPGNIKDRTPDEWRCFWCAHVNKVPSSQTGSIECARCGIFKQESDRMYEGEANITKTSQEQKTMDLETIEAEFNEGTLRSEVKLFRMLNWLEEDERYVTMENLMQRGLEIIGEGSRETFFRLSLRLGSIYWKQNKRVMAEEVYKDLSGKVNWLLQAESLDALEYANQLASDLLGLDNLHLAEMVGRKCIVACKTSVGPGSEQEIRSTRTLGRSLLAQERYQEAEYEFRQTLKRQHGTHISSGALEDTRWLAEALTKQEKLEEAESICRQALKDGEYLIFPNGLKRAEIKVQLGSILALRDEDDEARTLFSEALKEFEQSLPRGSLRTTDVLIKLGGLLAKQKQYVEAESIYRRALDPYWESHNIGHPWILSAIEDFTEILLAQAKNLEIMELYKRVEEALEGVLGPDDPKVLRFSEYLAATYESRKDLGAAATVRNKILKSNRDVLGPRHQKTLQSMLNLASIYKCEPHRLDDAVNLVMQVIDIRSEDLGKEHRDTLASMMDLASIYELHGRFQIAEPLYQRVTHTRARLLGPEHPETLEASARVAQIYWAQGNKERGKDLLSQVEHSYRTILGPDCLGAIEAAKQLGYWRLQSLEEEIAGEQIDQKAEAEEVAKKAKAEAEEAAAKLEEKEATVAAAPEERQKPIRFKDAIGRTFSFPFHLCRTWKVSRFLPGL